MKMRRPFRIREFKKKNPTYRRYLDDPLTQVGSFLTISGVNKEEYIALTARATVWLEKK